MVLDTPTKKQRRKALVEQKKRVWRDFLESYKSDILLEEYKAGRQLAAIAGERNIGCVKVLEEYFDARYGAGWKRHVKKRAYRTPPPNEESRRKISAIAEMLARGHSHKAIGELLGMSRQAVTERVHRYNLDGAAA